MRFEYCSYCQREGHTFRSCPTRDDDAELDEEIECHRRWSRFVYGG